MHALIVDTETSGLFDYSKPAHAEGQPYLAALSAVLVDEHGSVMRDMHRLIKPTEEWGEEVLQELKDGRGAFAINKLTYERMMAEGVPVWDALNEYDALTDACGGISGFNISYDQKVIRGAYRRNNRLDRYGERPTFCVMRGAGALLKQRGIKLGKVPNLAEAVRFLLERELDGAHQAPADTAATVELYRLLHKEGLVEWKPQVSKKGNGDE